MSPCHLAAFVLLLWSCAPRVRAADVLVSTPAEITAATATAQPGDTLYMRDGVWTDADILFSANGTAANPITLRPETLGGVHLTGLSRLRIAGSFLVIDGLVFTNGYRTNGDVIAFQDTSASVANNCRLTDCAIIGYCPPNGTLDTKWVSFYGYSNRMDNCYLTGKTNIGTTVVVWLDDEAAPNYHQIDHNYFGFRPQLGTNGSNGGETIRVGDSKFSFNNSRTTVEQNYFEQCNGDVEIISSKSSENIYRHNTFVDCEGGLCLRHGNRSIVEGNYFFGHARPLTGGVRIIGEDHKVYNNYFQDLAGSSSRAALVLMQGLTNTPLNGYFQVQRATVAFNTFVNCANTMLIGLSGTLSGTSYTTTLAPENCVMANNIAQSTGKLVDQRLAPTNLLWASNIFFGANLGISSNAGIWRIDPQLALDSNALWRPSPASPALGTAQGNYPFVTTDFEGQPRTAPLDIGCDQASAAPLLYPPLTATNIGPTWLRLRGTFLNWSTPADITYGTRLGPAQLNASANAAGTFTYNPPTNTLLNAGNGQTLTVVFTPNDPINFNAVTQTVTLNVLVATPLITWTNPAPITYGTLLGAEQYNAVANVPGTFTYKPGFGHLLNASNNQALTATFRPTDTNNYRLVSRDVTIDVAKATPAIVWTNPAPVEQGTLLSTAQLNATADAPGTFAYNPPAGTVLTGGSSQQLAVTFTPSNTANYFSASRTVTLNVTVGGKTLPNLIWPAPSPVLFGTPLGALQFNATADVPGTFTYSPAAGTILPAGTHVLSVLFRPTDSVTYTTAVKNVSLNVALLASNALVRVAYIVPSNRVAQAHAIGTLRNLVSMYQNYFADQMERNGFGRKTFTVETEADGQTPLIHVLPVPTTDTFVRGDIYGNRLLDTVRTAGLPVGAPGQVWWLIPETHIEHVDGTVRGGFEIGVQVPASPVDSGWAINGSDDLALYQTLYQTNALPYDGYVLPELGQYPLVQDLSFPWFEGITLSGVSSSAVGTGLRSLGEAFGLTHDYRNDENFNGNIMGFGFRGIRGVFYPDLYPYNYCGLSYASALALSVNPFFNPGRPVTDLVPPNVSISTSGERAPVNGLLEITFTASDDQGLHAALLTWQTDSEPVIAAETALSGTNVSRTFAIPYFSPEQTNRYAVTVFDRQGNRRSAQTAIYPTGSPNHSPEPFIRITPVIVGLGEDVVLDASDSFDREHGASLLEVEWDLDGDGFFDTEPSTDLIQTANYTNLGTYLIRARLTDPAGDVAISAPVAVSVVPCALILSPASKTHGYADATGVVKVISSPKCIWTAASTNDWLTVLSSQLIGVSARGDLVTNALSYSVEENPAFVERRGAIVIGDNVFPILQSAAICTYKFSPTNRFHGYGAGSGTAKVSTKTNCTWFAVNTNSWITITNGAAGTNTGTIYYSIAENRVAGRRTGYFTVNDQVFTVNQWGLDCEIVISPYWRTHSENSETGLVTVSTAGNCNWAVVNTNSWITLTNGDSGLGSGSFGYVLEPNLNPVPRVGCLTVGDQCFSITQQVCSYSISPSGVTHPFGVDTGAVVVAAGPVCAWTVSNTNDWVEIFSGASGGVGAGTVLYRVSENPRGRAREGTLSVAGYTYTVAQFERPCDFDIEPKEFSHGEESDFGDVFVDTTNGCPWSVSSSAAWVHVVDPGPGEGPGLVSYTVDANPGPARSTTLVIARQDYTISQASGVREVTASDMTLGSGETNQVAFTLNAHGGENNFAFSLCFNTNLLGFVSAQLRSGAPAGATLTLATNDAPLGRVGLGVALPNGQSMAPGPATVIQVSFRGLAIDGRQHTSVSVCDAPAPRQMEDSLGRPLSANFGEPSVWVIGFCSLGESLDAPDLVWTNGAIAWSCQTNVTHDGEDAASSGITPDNGESYFETTLLGPGLLSFWWKVSSEQDNDRLRFLMDGNVQFTISGQPVDWEYRTFNVPSGTHALRWRYNKNATLAVGQDRGWVDQVVYQPAAAVITNQPVSQIVDSGSTVTLRVAADGQPPLTYQWLFNNTPLADTAFIRGAASALLTLSNVQPSQAGTYAVVVASPQGNTISSNAAVGVIPLLPLAEALDATNFNWTTTNNSAAWVGQPVVSHDGVDAARSGNITNSQSSPFQTVVTGPGTLTFWWKCSSEPNNDKLTFYINGSSKGNISGEFPWQQKSFALNPGSNTLLWIYSKNSSVTLNQDRAWVDEVTLIPVPVAITTQPANVNADQGGTAAFSIIVTGTPPISYQWRMNGTNIPGAFGTSFSTNIPLVISNVQLENAGTYSVLVNNGAGAAYSSNATLQVNRLVPLPEAVNATNLVWITNGTPPWVGQTAVNHDGVDAARSGRIGNTTTNSFQTTVTGPGTVSFWWKVSSESGKDYLRFNIGSSEQERISGEVDWVWRSWTVPSGSQDLKWSYTKNGSIATNQDSGWVDQIYYVPANSPTPPIIAIQPTNRSIVAPATVSLNAVAVGSTPLGYQWMFNGAPLANGPGVSGVTTTNLTLTNAAAVQGGNYTLVATNAAGSVTSSVATLTVITAPIITSQPVSQNVLVGSTVIFNVGALGIAPLSYQWLCNGTNLVNGSKFNNVTTPTLTILNAQPTDEGSYSVIVSNSAGAVSTLQSGGTLTTWTAARTAAITHNQETLLAASVIGPGTLRFSWKVSSETNSDFFRFSIAPSAGAPIQLAQISGELDWKTQSFDVPSGPQTLQWRYSKDGAGSSGQDAGWLDDVVFTTTNPPTAPAITTQPANQNVPAGSTIAFNATLTGSTPMTFQWRLNGAPLQNGPAPGGGTLSGVTTPRLTMAGVQLADAGNLSLSVSNAAGSTSSSNAALAIAAPPVATIPVITAPPASQTASENARVTLSAVAAGTAPLSYQWQFNGQPLLIDNSQFTLSNSPSGSTLIISNMQASAIGNYSIVVSNSAGIATSANAALTLLTLAEAAGAPYLNMAMAGNASWIAQTAASAGAGNTHDGTSAVRTGPILDNQNTRLEAYVDGPGTITFWWKVSCEPNDNLRFYVGATEVARISGETPWTQQTFPVPAGTQILLKWRYGKDGSTSGGQDAGWLDDVAYVPSTVTIAPSMTNQPLGQSVLAGSTLAFQAGVSGGMPMTYQWRLNGTPLQNGTAPGGGTINGAKTPRLTLTGVSLAQAGNYSLLASNAAGTTTSADAGLTIAPVFTAPMISSQPLNQDAMEGATITFNVAALGSTPLTYQWQKDGIPFTPLVTSPMSNVQGQADFGPWTLAVGPAGSTLTISNVQGSNIGSYSCTASNNAGTAQSARASLTVRSLSEAIGAPYLSFWSNVQSPGSNVVGPWTLDQGQSFSGATTNGGARLTVNTLPAITSQPTSRTVVAGSTVSFTVSATGSAPLGFQWRVNGTNLVNEPDTTGANTATLTLANVDGDSIGNYSVLVTNLVGNATSSNAALTVLVPPVITSPPLSQTVMEGTIAGLNVSAIGTAPLFYQWRRNGTNLVNGDTIAGATNATLTLFNAQLAQSGIYSVEISNAVGVVVSSNVQVTVAAALTLGDGLNAPYLTWNTHPDVPWVVQTNVTHDGEGAARSGSITHSNNTWLETTITGPGTIRFWWKVSSQTNADVLTFTVGGSTWAQISGEVDWQRMSFSLPGGSVVLRWTYTKDGSITTGQDRGWLDEVDFVPTAGPSVPVIVQDPVGVDVDPGMMVTLSVQALGTAPLSYQWRYEGQNLADGGNVLGAKSPTLTLVNVQASQAGLYDVVVRNSYSLALSEEVFVNVIPIISLPVALDTDRTNLVWLTKGYSPWRGQTDYNVDRIDAAQSGPLPNSQSNWIETVVAGPGAVTFWWKVSSQTNSDRLRFLVDDVEMANISGEANWRQRIFEIPNLHSVLKWMYTKDGSGSAGLDRGWVDQVVFGPSAPIITNSGPDVIYVDQGTTVKFSVDASGTPPFSYQWQVNGTNLINSDTNLPPFPGFITGAVGNHRLVISNAQPAQSGLYVANVFNQAGVAISPPMSLQVVPALPLAAALNPNLVWETGGYSWWVGTTNVTHDGIMAARNGTLTGSDLTWMRTTVIGPGTLKFWWKASTETNVDIMTFRINGADQAQISGNQNWVQRSFELNTIDKPYVLEWEYSKSGLFTNGLDQVFVDEVSFGPVPPVVTNQPVALVTVDEGAVVNLTAGIKGTPPLNYQWLHNDDIVLNGGNISGANTATLKINGIQAAQAGAYSLAVLNAVGFVVSSNAVVSITPTFPLDEALETTGINWLPGSPAWVGQPTTTHDGIDAARSPGLSDSQSSTMQASIAGPGTISFWWKVSSETNADKLTFYINGTAITNISGEVNWQQRTYTLASGNNTLKWTYSKNGSGSAGSDRGWVDQFVFTPVPPGIASQPASTNVDQGTTAFFTVVPSGTPPFTYQWRLNGANLVGSPGTELEFAL